jgi:SAM-dependent methyltransferase
LEDNAGNVQSSYDRVAEEYARRFIDEPDTKPMDRQMLERFAGQVKGLGPVCDMGCGPGQIARYLKHCGLQDVFGMDLSPRMVAEATRLTPDIPFHQGDMLALPDPDNSWGGIAAFYSLIHIPPARMLQALNELKRVLVPGGVVLLTFHIGEGNSLHLDEWWDTPVDVTFFYFSVEQMENWLREAGFELVETIVRAPYAPEVEYQSHRAYIFARKPVT